MTTAVDLILRLADSAGPKCGEVTVIAIDGPAGSGKTTLAQHLAAVPPAQLVHMDDLYPGWDGLEAAGDLVAGILSSLARGEIATYHRYDWEAGAYAEPHDVDPRGIVIIEGVGSVRREYRDLFSVVVMVTEPDPDERLRRGLARDGEDALEQWRGWMERERQLHERVSLRNVADVVIDGTGEVVSWRE